MSLEALERVGKNIEAQLKEIRERIGAQLGEYSVPSTTIEISGKKLQELAEINPGQPIIIEGQLHLAYIKDHVFWDSRKYYSEVRAHPNGCFVKGRKVHFYGCRTLQYMNAKGQRDRYHATSTINNTQTIDLRNSNNVETQLAICKNCIRLLGTTGGINWLKVRRKESRIAQYADAKKFMDCVKSCHENRSDATQKTKDFFEST